MRPEEFKALMAKREPPTSSEELSAEPRTSPTKPKVLPTKPVVSPPSIAQQSEVTSSPKGKLTLAWNPSSESDTAGYRVRYGKRSGSHTGTFDAKKDARATILGLEPGTTYYFVVVAYNRAGQESPPSNEMKAVAK